MADLKKKVVIITGLFLVIFLYDIFYYNNNECRIDRNVVSATFQRYGINYTLYVHVVQKYTFLTHTLMRCLHFV